MLTAAAVVGSSTSVLLKGQALVARVAPRSVALVVGGALLVASLKPKEVTESSCSCCSLWPVIWPCLPYDIASMLGYHPNVSYCGPHSGELQLAGQQQQQTKEHAFQTLSPGDEMPKLKKQQQRSKCGALDTQEVMSFIQLPLQSQCLCH